MATAALPTPLTPPQNEQMLDARGNITQAWITYFQSLTDVTTGQGSTLGTQSATLQAVTNQIGDYKVSKAAAADIGPNWLICDGSLKLMSDYPALSALLGGIIGNFAVPHIPPVMDQDGQIAGYWWIKAL